MAAQASTSLRIAIAFVALKHKPAGMRFTEYILDLCTKFPAAHAADAWIRRAVELERRVGELREMYEEERMKCASLSVNDAASSTPAPAPEGPPKKKQKKKAAPQAETPAPDWAGLYASLPHSVLPALRLLTAEGEGRSSELIAAATERVIGGLGDILCGVLSAKTVLAKQREALGVICKLLEHVLSTALPELGKKLAGRRPRRISAGLAALETAIDDIFGLLLTRILVPAIRGFATLSRLHIRCYCSGKRSKKELAAIVDVRADVFCLVDAVLSGLESLAANKPCAKEKMINGMMSVKEGAALAVVRELERVYPDVAQCVKEGSARTKADRMDALARKDAVWYLCNVLNVLAREDSKVGSPLDEVERTSVLRAGIAVALEMLVKRVDGLPGTGRMGAVEYGRVEYGMVLSVLERAWGIRP
ncbi:hypothetical protein NEOLEDRAFT_1179061 [Neolentinus lepideus HHB14362 ss-1]|uniref:Uncharacterized protein n=1 Tax=Neolentinus lepideus HHB14362 ss-1 TaxID=1314782 RepID=A0A165S5G0_9AGAM|nr:hypothetical protein NEOLEDRAFT_1179061 [Neolentinus lepideus HHB14362 ss-1]